MTFWRFFHLILADFHKNIQENRENVTHVPTLIQINNLLARIKKEDGELKQSSLE
jgi:hypothetical protein